MHVQRSKVKDPVGVQGTRRPVVAAIFKTALVSVRDLVPSKVCFVLCTSALNITTEARVTPWSTEKNLPPRYHQLRKVIQASTKKSAFRDRYTNAESQWLQAVAVTEYCLCHRHTRAIPILRHRSISVSST